MPHRLMTRPMIRRPLCIFAAAASLLAWVSAGRSALTTAPSTAPAVVPTPPPLTAIKEGTYLADRVGRLRFNPIGPYPHFDFWEAGQRVRVDLLPNRNLMAMEQAAFWDARLRFRVSGQITSYNGKDYLLVLRVTKATPSSAPATSVASTQPTTAATPQP